jgi:hypothetical protein
MLCARSTRSWLLLPWLVLASAAACATPTLPLPPPAALESTAPDADGMVTVTGEVLPDAWVYCVNLELETGVIVRADGTGRFTLRIGAEAGQYLSVWQEDGVDRGPPVDIRVPAM